MGVILGLHTGLKCNKILKAVCLKDLCIGGEASPNTFIVPSHFTVACDHFTGSASSIFLCKYPVQTQRHAERKIRENEKEEIL